MNNDQIKKIIESCHLNFLIGSGASKPYLGTLGTIEQLLTDLSERANSDEKTIIEASIKKHYFEVAIKGNINILKGTSENLIVTKQAYKEFINALDTILVKRKSNLVSKQVNLFTTNMDLFLETTLEDANLTFNDGFTGRLNPVFGTENFHNSVRKTSTHYEYQSEMPLFNVFKLHGSLNWRQEDEKIAYDYNLSTLNMVSKIETNENDFLDIEYQNSEDIWSSYTVEELYDNLENHFLTKEDIHDEFLTAYNQLLMINPTKEKFETTTRNLTFYELLRMYSNHLERENSVLFVFGFSFADEHIKEITKRVTVSNPTLIIIIFAFDKASKEAIEKELPQRSNIKILFDESGNQNYSLETINTKYFKKLAGELKNE